MELGPKNHNGDGLLGPNSIMVVYMDPLGYYSHPQAQISKSGNPEGPGTTLVGF